MRKKPYGPIWLASVALILASLACDALAPAATPTATPVPATATATKRPTSTPRPTLPPPTATPTPAPVGVPVTYKSLEITVLAALHRTSMYLGDISGRYTVYYTAPAGYWIIDVGVLVHNQKPDDTVRVKWGNVYIVEGNGNAWFPYWAKTKTVSSGGSKLDPFGFGLSSDNINGDDFVEFVNDTYLRLVFLVANDPAQTIIFAIEDSPLIAFQVKK